MRAWRGIKAMIGDRVFYVTVDGAPIGQRFTKRGSRKLTRRTFSSAPPPVRSVRRVNPTGKPVA
jgi:hypothetical protein